MSAADSEVDEEDERKRDDRQQTEGRLPVSWRHFRFRVVAPKDVAWITSVRSRSAVDGRRYS